MNEQQQKITNLFIRRLSVFVIASALVIILICGVCAFFHRVFLDASVQIALVTTAITAMAGLITTEITGNSNASQ